MDQDCLVAILDCSDGPFSQPVALGIVQTAHK